MNKVTLACLRLSTFSHRVQPSLSDDLGLFGPLILAIMALLQPMTPALAV